MFLKLLLNNQLMILNSFHITYHYHHNICFFFFYLISIYIISYLNSNKQPQTTTTITTTTNYYFLVLFLFFFFLFFQNSPSNHPLPLNNIILLTYIFVYNIIIFIVSKLKTQNQNTPLKDEEVLQFTTTQPTNQYIHNYIYIYLIQK